jgi:tetratricopeptide (TPR) repeat protein
MRIAYLIYRRSDVQMKEGVNKMVLRMVPVMVILLFVLFPTDLAQMPFARAPLYTPETAPVVTAAAVLNDQGVELYKGGRFEEALGSFILASEADPTFAIAHYNCAVVLTTRGLSGDMGEAMRHLERSYLLDPGNEMIREFMMELMTIAPLTA